MLELIDRAYETYRATNVLLERSALQMIKPYEEQIVLPPDKQQFIERSKTQARKQRQGLFMKVATALMAVALLVGGGFYQEALRQKKIAIAEKDNALRRQSLFLADLARQENEKHSSANGILLALEALPKTMATSERPYVPEAKAQLYAAVTRLYERKVLRGHQGLVVSAAVSPDGTRIVTASYDGTARVWDAASGKELAALRGHEDWVRSAAFSPDGTRIVTASEDGTARVWEAASGKETATLRGHEDDVWSAAFSPDGTRIVTASGGTAKVWRVFPSTQALIDYANTIVPRRLTPEERKRYFLE